MTRSAWCLARDRQSPDVNDSVMTVIMMLISSGLLVIELRLNPFFFLLVPHLRKVLVFLPPGFLLAWAASGSSKHRALAQGLTPQR